MSTFLAVPTKKSNDVDLVKPLRNFIQNTYSDADPESYNQSINEFNKLRNLMLSKSADKHETALEILYRYYDQLTAIENKLPIAENQIRVQFKWKDAFDKESWFSGKRTLAIASASFEKVCMIFNIAALQSQIAAIQNVESDEGLKNAAKLFQQSSGLFGHMKDVVLSHVQQDPTPDLNPDTLGALAALMLAQGQESIYRKSAVDRMKENVVAKLAHQCSDLYSDALKLMQLQSVKEIWPKDWILHVAMRKEAFLGLAQYYQSVVCKQSKSYGEEISRLMNAQSLLNSAQAKGPHIFPFKHEIGRVQNALQAAKKDNDFIYHDKVPDVKTLNAIGKAVVAKPLPLPDKMSENFSDLFEKLVPLPVHNALTAFESRKNQISNMEMGRLMEATTFLDSCLASLNLPAALEDLSGGGIPASLLEKAQNLRQEGGITALDKLMSDLPSLLSRNREILNESVKLLDDEEKSDTQLKEQFKEKWTRTPSNKLTQPMRDEGKKYQQILDNAIQADRIVQEKYGKHKNAISTLSKPEAEIHKAIPSSSTSGPLKDSPVVQQLKKMMEEVETIKAERQVIDNEIKEAKFDMSSKFFMAMTQDGLISEESISVQELDKVYCPLREQVSGSIHKQEELISRIQTANNEFSQAKSSNQTSVQRETVLKDLAAGYAMFLELKGNLVEGTKFYNDLTPLLVRLQSKITDFCFARKTEKDELMSDLQKQIVSQPTAAPPAAPTYQTGQPPENKPTAPARPPPPKMTPQQTPAGQAPSAASAPPATSAPPAGAPTQPQQPPQQPPQQAYGSYGGQWGQPYPQYPMTGGYPMPSMPSAYNPYNPYMAGPQAGYPQQQQTAGYPQQQPPAGYPQQYPQQYPGQQYPQNPQYPTQNPQWR